jgi:hypothetical protein
LDYIKNRIFQIRSLFDIQVLRGVIMNENWFDIAFLMGREYLNSLSMDPSDLDVQNFLLESGSKFLKGLPRIITSMISNIGLETLSKRMCVPKAFIESLDPDVSRGGRCNICDRYYSRLRNHLKKTHYFNLLEIIAYNALFGESNYYYMPSVFKSLEDFPLDIRKIVKKRKQKLNPVKEPRPEDNFMNKRLTKKPISKLDEEQFGGFVCKICGKMVKRNKRKPHMKNHRECGLLDCPRCENRYRGRDLAAHLRVCGINKFSS